MPRLVRQNVDLKENNQERGRKKRKKKEKKKNKGIS
jgi:hypothetical protein